MNKNPESKDVIICIKDSSDNKAYYARVCCSLDKLANEIMKKLIDMPSLDSAVIYLLNLAGQVQTYDFKEHEGLKVTTILDERVILLESYKSDIVIGFTFSAFRPDLCIKEIQNELGW